MNNSPNIQTLILFIFLIVTLVYLYICYVTIKENYRSRSRKEYIVALLCLCFSAFFYGLSSITGNDLARLIFWGLGFFNFFMFMPVWIRFIANLTEFKPKRTNFLFQYGFIILSLIYAICFVIFTNPNFITTDIGYLAKYSVSVLAILHGVFALLFTVIIFLLHLKWYKQAFNIRTKKQQKTFLILSVTMAVFGFATDFAFPLFPSVICPPLIAVLMIVPSYYLFYSMKINNTIDINPKNVAESVFYGVNLPLIILDEFNSIKLLNEQAKTYLFPNSLNLKINNFILLNNQFIDDEFLNQNKKNVSVTFKGQKNLVVNLSLFIKYDKSKEIVFKTLILADITEIQNSNQSLVMCNAVAAKLINADSNTFKNDLLAATLLIKQTLNINSFDLYQYNEKTTTFTHYFNHLNKAIIQKSLITLMETNNYAPFIIDAQINSWFYQAIGFGSETTVYIYPLITQEKIWGFVLASFSASQEMIDIGNIYIENILQILFNAVLKHEAQMQKEISYKYSKLILDFSPISAQLWDINGNCLDCNEATLKLLKIASKNDFVNNYDHYLPEFQANFVSSTEAKNQYIEKAKEMDSVSFFWNFIDAFKQKVEVEVTLIKTITNNEMIFVAFCFEVGQHNLMKNQIKRSYELVEASNLAANTILNAQNNDFFNSLKTSIKIFAATLNLQYITIWQNIKDNDKLVAISLLNYYENKINYKNGSTFSYDSLPGYETRLRNNETIFVTATTMTEAEKKFFRTYDIKSIFIIPIFIESEFFGLVCFSDFINERTYDAEEIPFLNQVSIMLINALRRNELISDLQVSATSLKQALIEANAASVSKSRFLSNMSHEMRTPMNAIIGLSKIGLKNENTVDKNIAFEKINNASNHLLELINNILDIAKIEEDKFELVISEFNIYKLIDTVITITKGRADAVTKNLLVQIDSNTPDFLYGDEMKIIQILNNICSNAVKFSKANEKVCLNVAANKIDEQIYNIVFTIMDYGIGIPKEKLNNVFNPFEQVDSSISRKYGGTGLGLAIVKQLVNLMHGTIDVSSIYGEGTTFTVSIPLKASLKTNQSLIEGQVYQSNYAINIINENNPDGQSIIKILKKAQITFYQFKPDDPLIYNYNINKNRAYIYLQSPNLEDDLVNIAKIKKLSNVFVAYYVSTVSWDEIKQYPQAKVVDFILFQPILPSTVINFINVSYGILFENHTIKRNYYGKKILLVEDIALNREIFLSLFEEYALNIDTAVNGQEAYNMVVKAPTLYNLIFMDVNMPVMDGFAATKKIREFEANSKNKIPIIAMTANVFADDVKKCYEAGMDGHVGKPISVEAVVAILDKYIGSNKKK